MVVLICWETFVPTFFGLTTQPFPKENIPIMVGDSYNSFTIPLLVLVCSFQRKVVSSCLKRTYQHQLGTFALKKHTINDTCTFLGTFHQTSNPMILQLRKS
jgi:hypothetical protein